jgi:hypothetical protein
LTNQDFVVFVSRVGGPNRPFQNPRGSNQGNHCKAVVSSVHMSLDLSAVAGHFSGLATGLAGY